MISREEAKTRIEGFKVDGWDDQQQRRLAALPKSLREPAQAAFGTGHQYYSPWYRGGNLSSWADLAAADRARIFEAAAPGHAAALERTWQLCLRLPYQTGPNRRPFRAIDRPDVYLDRQVQAIRGAAASLAQYRGDVGWVADWCGYLWADTGPLLAAEIDSGPQGEQVFAALAETIAGTHTFASISRSAIRGLLMSDRPDAWASVERLLLAAQRQEGIRQVVFESADEVHPEVFARILRLAVDEKLTRFAAVVRGFSVWMGIPADVTERRQVERNLAQLCETTTSAAAAAAAIASAEPETVYLGLWSHATNDASGATSAALPLLDSADPAKRYAVAHFLSQVGLPEARTALRALLEDEDRVIAASAFVGLAGSTAEPDDFAALEKYLQRLGKDRKLQTPLWPWLELGESPSEVATRMLHTRGAIPAEKLHPYLPKLNAQARSTYAFELNKQEQTAATRAAFVDLVTDRSQWVATKAFEALARSGIAADEAPIFEALLTRKSGATRSAAIGMLLSLSDSEVLASADRLLISSKSEQRLGGLDLLRQLREAGRCREEAEAGAAAYVAKRKKVSALEQTALNALVSEAPEDVSLVDGLGLFDPAQLVTPSPVKKQRIKVTTSSYSKLLKDADGLVDRYRETPLVTDQGWGREERLYGDQRWGLQPRPGDDPSSAPLVDLWGDWWSRQRPARFDLERAVVGGETWQGNHHKAIAKKALPRPVELSYRIQVDAALWWIWLEHGTDAGLQFFLDGYENALAMVPKNELSNPMIEARGYFSEFDWRQNSPLVAWWAAARDGLALRPDLATPQVVNRMWELANWVDRPAPEAPRSRPSLQLLQAALDAGLAGRTEVLDELIGERGGNSRSYSRWRFTTLAQATRRRVADEFVQYPLIIECAALARDRAVEVELRRGDVATAASGAAISIRSIPGAANVLSFLTALGSSKLQRGWTWNAEQKSSVLSHLIRVSTPDETDTPASFVELVKAENITERRLLELAIYAPQWSRYVEHAVGWDGLEDAVYWLHAHTKDTGWSVDADLRDEWAAEIALRTPLSAADLVDGGVDVGWFHRMLNVVGADRWESLLEYVKYASGGGGHKRAELFGEALRGSIDVVALEKRIKDKRHQDSVRALGLVPLAAGAARAAEVHRRYRLLHEFKKGSRKFGSQRQASEKRAFEIGLDNLARTAGYADPVRLQWEMETMETADLAAGPIVLERGEYRFELAIDALGRAELNIAKDGKALKSMPAKHRKDEEAVALRDRAKALRSQVARMRSSLETGAVNGDTLTGAELQRLHEHPVMRPMLTATVMALPDGTLGMPEDDGGSLRPVAGRKRKVGNRSLRIAHPVDFVAAGEWSQWQQYFFLNEIIQPFKQVFRELYIPTAAETEDGKKSMRYAGHQVNPRQANALFGARGWVSHPDGFTIKTFHREGLVANVVFDGATFGPADVDGATLYGLVFQKRNERDLLDLTDVPPRLFSEVMRDLDLVVSVAHMGGVDPEASASTIEMRQALVRETAMLLKLDNVRFAGSHVVIDGKIGSYSVHMGSGVVHRQPGGAVCIIPVGSQHRGRLFLPFADDDPKTAEVVSKTVLLAKDDEIRDPTILEQIR